MDSCCAAMKASTNVVDFYTSMSNGGTLFGGESISENLKCRRPNTQLWKNLRTKSDKGMKIVKPGVTNSIVTSNVNKETQVSNTLSFSFLPRKPKEINSLFDSIKS